MATRFSLQEILQPVHDALQKQDASSAEGSPVGGALTKQARVRMHPELPPPVYEHIPLVVSKLQQWIEAIQLDSMGDDVQPFYEQYPKILTAIYGGSDKLMSLMDAFRNVEFRESPDDLGLGKGLKAKEKLFRDAAMNLRDMVRIEGGADDATGRAPLSFMSIFRTRMFEWDAKLLPRWLKDQIPLDASPSAARSVSVFGDSSRIRAGKVLVSYEELLLLHMVRFAVCQRPHIGDNGLAQQPHSRGTRTVGKLIPTTALLFQSVQTLKSTNLYLTVVWDNFFALFEPESPNWGHSKRLPREQLANRYISMLTAYWLEKDDVTFAAIEQQQSSSGPAGEYPLIVDRLHAVYCLINYFHNHPCLISMLEGNEAPNAWLTMIHEPMLQFIGLQMASIGAYDLYKLGCVVDIWLAYLTPWRAEWRCTGSEEAVFRPRVTPVIATRGKSWAWGDFSEKPEKYAEWEPFVVMNYSFYVKILRVFIGKARKLSWELEALHMLQRVLDVFEPCVFQTLCKCSEALRNASANTGAKPNNHLVLLEQHLKMAPSLKSLEKNFPAVIHEDIALLSAQLSLVGPRGGATADSSMLQSAVQSFVSLFASAESEQSQQAAHQRRVAATCAEWLARAFNPPADIIAQARSALRRELLPAERQGVRDHVYLTDDGRKQLAEGRIKSDALEVFRKLKIPDRLQPARSYEVKFVLRALIRFADYVDTRWLGLPGPAPAGAIPEELPRVSATSPRRLRHRLENAQQTVTLHYVRVFADWRVLVLTAVMLLILWLLIWL